MGCDQQPALPRIKMHIFQSTHPVWDATRDIANEYARCLFQSTHPVWDATDVVVSSDLVHGISIHASRMGCDLIHRLWCFGLEYFNPRIPYGMRQYPKLPSCSPDRFQSTHPVWDATCSHVLEALGRDISIHASRMGCDRKCADCRQNRNNFNTRIPYGMRPR